MHGDEHFFTPFLILLASAAVVSTVFHRLRLPSLLAFLLVGLVLGPNVIGVIEDVEQLRAIAELGLVFLLFLLGLEFSLPRLMAMRNAVFRLGGTQVLLCTLAFFLAFYWWGLDWQIALLLAGGLALSSTAIVSKELIERGQLHQRHGQIAIGILLFQDLVAVGLLISVPLMASDSTQASGSEILITLAKSAGLLVAFFLFARFGLPWLLREVARTRSNELLVFAALVTVLLAAVITDAIGLSMELGAFLAGMMLSETRFKHQLEADLRPFRDVLLGLFFISVGMLLDTQLLQEYWFRILYCGVLLLLFKSAIIAVMAKLLGETWRVALPAAMALAQGGEFLFALLALATRDALVANDVASFLLSVTIVSMALTPLLMRHSTQIVGFFEKRSAQAPASQTSADDIPAELAQQSHVIILGFGRVGQTVARFLKPLGIPYLALETDPVRLSEARAAGEPVFYGDSSRVDILKAAGIEHASLLLISFDDHAQAEHILKLSQGLKSNLKALVRTRDDSHLEALIAAGAHEVVPETLEASLMLVSHVLFLLNVPVNQAQGLIDKARRDRYQLLHGFYHGQGSHFLNDDGTPAEVLHAVTISQDAWAKGKQLGELDSATAQQIREIHRHGEVIPQSEFQSELNEGDVVIITGVIDDIDRAEALLLKG